jgi:hypothetical protein
MEGDRRSMHWGELKAEVNKQAIFEVLVFTLTLYALQGATFLPRTKQEGDGARWTGCELLHDLSSSFVNLPWLPVGR